MLDTKSTFDQLVTQLRRRPTSRPQRILDNRFYRNISGALVGHAGVHGDGEAHELHDDGGFDLIVVDTPPTRHALDFLDAPRRLTRLLDNRIFRMLMVPTRACLRVGERRGAGVPAHGRRASSGAEVDRRHRRVLPRVRRHGGGLPRPRRRRCVDAARRADETAFVLVTSPRRDAVEEAEFFAERLAEHGDARSTR